MLGKSGPALRGLRLIL